MAAAVQTLTGLSRLCFTLTSSSLDFSQLAIPRTGTKILTSAALIHGYRLPNVLLNQAPWPKTGTMTLLIKRVLPLAQSRSRNLSFIPALSKGILPRIGTTISKITISMPLTPSGSALLIPKQRTGTKSSLPTSRRQKTGTTSLDSLRTRNRPTRRTER